VGDTRVRPNFLALKIAATSFSIQLFDFYEKNLIRPEEKWDSDATMCFYPLKNL
jgi:hypothetical protein